MKSGSWVTNVEGVVRALNDAVREFEGERGRVNRGDQLGRSGSPKGMDRS